MRFEEVKYIAKYYKAIPGMLKLLRQERADINNEYGGLHGMDMDGMPHGTTPGKPVEALCINAILHPGSQQPLNRMTGNLRSAFTGQKMNR